MNWLTCLGIILIFLGTICTYLGKDMETKKSKKYFTEVVTAKEKEIIKLQQENTNLQLNAIYYTEELSQTIDQIWFKVKLKKDVKISDLYPIRIGIAIEPMEQNPKIWSRFFIQSAEMKRKNELLPFYRVLSGKFKVGDDIYSESIGYSNPVIDSIVVPITFVNQDELIIKDWHKKPFVVHLQDKIIQIAERVQLIINGWPILDEKISDVFWADLPEGTTWENIGSISDLKRSVMNHPSKGKPYTLWVIDIYNKLPQKIEGFPYRENPLIRNTLYKVNK